MDKESFLASKDFNIANYKIEAFETALELKEHLDQGLPVYRPQTKSLCHFSKIKYGDHLYINQRGCDAYPLLSYSTTWMKATHIIDPQEGKWAVSQDEEMWDMCETFDTKEEAIKYGKEEFKEEFESFFYLGQCFKYKIPKNQNHDAVSFIKSWVEIKSEQCELLPDLTERWGNRVLRAGENVQDRILEKLNEIDDIILRFAPVDFYEIRNIKEIACEGEKDLRPKDGL